MAASLSFWVIVVTTFLWGYGDGVLHGPWPPPAAPAALMFLGMMVLGAIVPAIRLTGKRGSAPQRNLDFGVAVIGAALAAATAAAVFIGGMAVEYWHRHPGGGGAVGAAALAAAWHALTVAAIGLSALASRGEPKQPPP